MNPQYNPPVRDSQVIKLEECFVAYRFEHPEKRRYYSISIAKDLFGDIVITRAWGGINKASGRIKLLPCKDLAEGLRLVAQLTKIRLTRGYILRYHSVSS